MRKELLKILNTLSAKLNEDLKSDKSSEQILKEIEVYFQQLAKINDEIKKNLIQSSDKM